MDIAKLRELLAEVQHGQTGVDQALERLRVLPYEDMNYAQLDLHRALRNGLPEVIFCQNKTPEQIVGIFQRLAQYHDRVLGTRASPDTAAIVQSRMPEIRYDPISRLMLLAHTELPPAKETDPYVLVASAGTADMPVAEEAAQTLAFLGDRVECTYDVGVAGLHRLLDKRELLFGASVIISVAGMEGALTSVIGGLASCPVIGVPTSVGYGANFAGLAPLLAMLNSCASGVAVVNIDNGFGAAVFAHTILSQIRASQLGNDPS